MFWVDNDNTTLAGIPGVLLNRLQSVVNTTVWLVHNAWRWRRNFVIFIGCMFWSVLHFGVPIIFTSVSRTLGYNPWQLNFIECWVWNQCAGFDQYRQQSWLRIWARKENGCCQPRNELSCHGHWTLRQIQFLGSIKCSNVGWPVWSVCESHKLNPTKCWRCL